MGSACVTRTGTAIAALVVLCSLAGCGGSGAADAESPLESAFSICNGSTLTAADSGHTVIVDTKPGGGFSGGTDDLVCMLDALHTPDRVVHEMETTTALMGRQSEQADGLSYEWSYHPDNGLDLTISDGD